MDSIGLVTERSNLLGLLLSLLAYITDLSSEGLDSGGKVVYTGRGGLLVSIKNR